MLAPGHIRNTLQKTYITIGELDGSSSERVVRLQKACERARVMANISTDILSALWEKLILVGPYGGVGAVTRAPQGVFRSMPETRQLLEGAIHEALTVARANGAALSDNTVKQTLAWLDHGPVAGIGAMQRDIMAGRPSELETQIGAVVRLAQAVGVEVPRHAFLYASLLPQERKARGEIEFPTAEEKFLKAA
jgi:2-dehydropantoate 2-reductase